MGSMLSLLDVLPRHERVEIGGGQAIDVFGVSGEDIGRILAQHPNAFQQLIDSGGKPMGLDPRLLGALIAACQRNGEHESLLGNDEVERMSRSLGIGAQMKIMQALGRCTFPDGIGPFLEGLISMSSAATEAMQIVVRVASRDQATASRPTPKRSAPPATPASGS